MVDITITPGNVVSGTNAQVEYGLAGAPLLAGQLVYKDSTVGKYLLADTNSATVEARRPRGVALNSASLNQPVGVQTFGDITIGATLTAGTAYYASDTAGGICPVADVGTGEAVCLLGLAKSTTVLGLEIQFPGVVL